MTCARSSGGQSTGLLSRGSQVRVLPGAPLLARIREVAEWVRGIRRQLRRSPRPVGTYQLKYFPQFLAHF